MKILCTINLMLKYRLNKIIDWNKYTIEAEITAKEIIIKLYKIDFSSNVIYILF